MQSKYVTARHLGRYEEEGGQQIPWGKYGKIVYHLYGMLLYQCYHFWTPEYLVRSIQYVGLTYDASELW